MVVSYVIGGDAGFVSSTVYVPPACFQKGFVTVAYLQLPTLFCLQVPDNFHPFSVLTA